MNRYAIEMINGRTIEIETEDTVEDLYTSAIENNGFIFGEEFLINLFDISNILKL
jgi:hypothetical protein